MHILITIETAIIKITMLNSRRKKVQFDLSLLVKMALAVFIFTNSIFLLHFGYGFSPLDMAEQKILRAEAQNEMTPPNPDIADRCTQYKNLIGYRLICRKFLTDYYFKSNSSGFDAADAARLITAVLAISPFEPAYWLVLSNMKQLQLEDPVKSIAALRLSYLSGRSVAYLAYSRFRTASSLWDYLEPSDKSIAINDFLIADQKQTDAMMTAIAAAPNSVARDMFGYFRLKNISISEDATILLRGNLK